MRLSPLSTIFAPYASVRSIFDKRRALGHHDRRRDAEPLGVIRDPLRMVTGRHRNHASTARARIQRQQLGERAALLERAGAMQGLKLQMDLDTGKFRD